MALKKEKRGLGRGLSALMADVAEEQPAPAARDGSVRTVPIDQISANPQQPRKVFDTGPLEELAASVRAKGLLQPIVLRTAPNGRPGYEIVAGERRWRAAQLAQLHQVPAIIREFSDVEVLEVAIVENVQRQDLNPVEEAQGYRALMETFGHTQEQLAEALGKSRSYIANTTRLLTLPAAVLDYLSAGKLSVGHARALITAADPEALAQLIVKKGLSVREAEKLAKSGDSPKPVKARTGSHKKDADTRALEADLSAALAMKVAIDHGPDGESGELRIRYKTLDELDDLCRHLSAVRR